MALTLVAWLDDTLEHVLKRRFLNKPEAIEKLFGIDRPLSSLSAKINLAHVLGILNDDLYSDFDIARNIRNDFAHLRDDLSFQTQSIRDRCANFRIIEGALGTQPDQVRNHRDLFVVTLLLLIGCCLRLAEQSQPPQSSLTLDEIRHEAVQVIGKVSAELLH
jgi:DNA-binding MltR family transcriptional regulator